ncbi:GT2 family glycosyltransferase [Breznakia sp. PF5-3]|uniref:glycosyltransferase family 2 protein n=1 Tax=unclassified Breznakia TaxID=2623764 RepID=UPI002404E820|nr:MULTISPECIES: glycosyltransferase [unclassified Breznakia]MDF9824975.1 GT2 family glycosyltransferase [Breznakia sp. PM6-1]MDF9835832.1 GT2 family glycosyltransferase [Breznakia sp. PF5-3]MDF9836916.1 GT2 family glycosyltransferase [Breznakia sp. PFB2-8]MDF9859862.1 GT2 family glycosyltransferase [Breznakia sp. PH5-24]
MKTAFLIINYNDAITTKKLLNSIESYSFIDMIVVVDNASTDNSFEILKEYEKTEHFYILKSDKNGGYGYGINYGSKYIIDILGDCRIIVSNSDIEIKNEQILISILDDFPDNAGIIAPIVKEKKGLNRGWKIPTPFQDGLLNLVFIHRILRSKLLLYPDIMYHDKLVEVEAVSGSFFIIDSNALIEADFYDENVFLYYEENIIGKKMKKLGKKTYVNTEQEVFHNHSVSIDKSIDKINKYRELKKSQLYFQCEYNHAGIMSRLFLKVTEKFSLFILRIVYHFK